MRKKIGLFFGGFVLAAGAFWTYQYFSGASLLTWKKPAPPVETEIIEERPPTFESRTATGDLEYLLSTKKAIPLKDLHGNTISGQYALTLPTATWYTDDGRVVYLRSDTGTVSLDMHAQGKNGKTKVAPRGGHLAGHVVITMTPKEAFKGEMAEMQPGELRITLEKDLDMNAVDNVLTSPGAIHVRSEDVTFDGENLTIAFNPEAHRIEFLRIEPTSGKDNLIIIKHAGHGLGLDALSTADTSTTKPGINGTSGVASSAPLLPEMPEVPQVIGGESAAVVPAPTTAAGTQPKKPQTAPTTYKLSFGENVKADFGTSQLTSDRLFVLFMTNGGGNGNAGTQPAKRTGPTTATSAPAFVPPTEAGARMPATATAPAATKPAANANDADLKITWTGPMEMRPAGDGDLKLMDGRDKALEAIGTVARPVHVTSETHQVAIAGRLWFHQGEKRVELEPGEVGKVDVTDPAMGHVICQGLGINETTQTVKIKGPGTLDGLVNNSTKTTTKPSTKVAAAPQAVPEKVVASWDGDLTVGLAWVGEGKKHKRVPQHVTFDGHSVIRDPNLELASDTLDVLVATAADQSSESVLQHLLATGHVDVKIGRDKLGVMEAAHPDGIQTDRLEIQTAIPPGGTTPKPAQLLADGHVRAWQYSEAAAKSTTKSAKAQPGKLTRVMLETGNLAVAMEPKVGAKGTASTAAVTGATTDSMRSVNVRSLQARDGARITFTDGDAAPVIATAKTLDVDGHENMTLADATLLGAWSSSSLATASDPDDRHIAQVYQGESRMRGEKILMHHDTRMAPRYDRVEIPGPGTFVFMAPGNTKSDPPMPVEVTWTQRMSYDSRSYLARFIGDIDAHAVGQRNMVRQMTCHDALDVQMTMVSDEAAATRPAGKASDAPLFGAGTGRMRLASMTALGNVSARGMLFTPDGTTMLSGFLLEKADKILYTEADKTLFIPGPGQMLIQDHNVQTPSKTSQGSQGDSAITWDGTLRYTRASTGGGIITVTKDVYVKHVPLKSAVVKADETKKGDDLTGPTTQDREMTLQTDQLVAFLSSSKGGAATQPVPASSSPLDLGNSGGQKIEKIDATGSTILKSGEQTLTAKRLTYEALKQTASAYGDRKDPAQAFSSNQGNVSAEEIIWDMTKYDNALTLIHPYGTFVQPSK